MIHVPLQEPGRYGCTACGSHAGGNFVQHWALGGCWKCRNCGLLEPRSHSPLCDGRCSSYDCWALLPPEPSETARFLEQTSARRTMPHTEPDSCPVCGDPSDALEELPPETGRPGGLMCHGCIEAAHQTECTCYEVIGGHQPGCAFYGRPEA